MSEYNKLFTLRDASYNLRGNYILTPPVPRTTTYGLQSFPYHAAKQCNLLPDSVRTSKIANPYRVWHTIKYGVQGVLGRKNVPYVDYEIEICSKF